MLVKAGAPVESTIDLLMPLLEKGDIIIDGGNEWYENTEHRQKKVAEKGLMYLGMGVSGGEEGARNGEPPVLSAETFVLWFHASSSVNGDVNGDCAPQQPLIHFGFYHHELLCLPLAVFNVVIAILLP